MGDQMIRFLEFLQLTGIFMSSLAGILFLIMGIRFVKIAKLDRQKEYKKIICGFAYCCILAAIGCLVAGIFKYFQLYQLGDFIIGIFALSGAGILFVRMF